MHYHGSRFPCPYPKSCSLWGLFSLDEYKYGSTKHFKLWSRVEIKTERGGRSEATVEKVTNFKPGNESSRVFRTGACLDWQPTAAICSHKVSHWGRAQDKEVATKDMCSAHYNLFPLTSSLCGYLHFFGFCLTLSPFFLFPWPPKHLCSAPTNTNLHSPFIPYNNILCSLLTLHPTVSLNVVMGTDRRMDQS